MPKLLLVFPKTSSRSSIASGWLMVFLMRNTEQKALFVGCIEKAMSQGKNEIYTVLKLPEKDNCYQQSVKNDLLLINPKLDEYVKEVEGSKSNLRKKYKGLDKYLYNSSGTIEIESLPNFLAQLDFSDYKIVTVKDFSYCTATAYPILLKPLQDSAAETNSNNQTIGENIISTSSDKSVLAITRFFSQQNHVTDLSVHNTFYKDYNQDIAGNAYDQIDKIIIDKTLLLELLINLVNIDYNKNMLMRWVERRLSFHKTATEYKMLATSIEKLDKLRNGELPEDKNYIDFSLTKSQLISTFMLFIIEKIQNLNPKLFKNLANEQLLENRETIAIQSESKDDDNNNLSKQALTQ